jgi:hypothetical protein
LLGQQPRSNKAISAIVSWPGNHHHSGTGWVPLDDAIGHRPPGILHQGDAWNSARDGQAVGFRHLGRGEEFDHAQRTLGAAIAHPQAAVPPRRDLHNR